MISLKSSYKHILDDNIRMWIRNHPTGLKGGVLSDMYEKLYNCNDRFKSMSRELIENNPMLKYALASNM